MKAASTPSRHFTPINYTPVFSCIIVLLVIFMRSLGLSRREMFRPVVSRGHGKYRQGMPGPNAGLYTEVGMGPQAKNRIAPAATISTDHYIAGMLLTLSAIELFVMSRTRSVRSSKGPLETDGFDWATGLSADFRGQNKNITATTRTDAVA